MRINHQRILNDLRELAEFGKEGQAVNRPFLSAADRASREWLLGKMREAGLEAYIDGVGNVYGRAKGVEHALLIGSHTDSVPMGGWLDGTLGVIYGLEMARSRAESEEMIPLGVDVISFADEEGAFAAGLGSRSFCGLMGEEDLLAKNADGLGLQQALDTAGYCTHAPAALNPNRYRAYLEAHIEQGPVLEAEGKRIGVVTDIVGIRRAEIQISGRADHAGTTPMGMRRDAGMALINLCHDLVQRFRRVSHQNTVWNFGRVEFEPGGAGVVPSKATLLLEYRDASEQVLSRIEGEIEAAISAVTASSQVSAKVVGTKGFPPSQMDSDLVVQFEAAAIRCNAPAKRMVSGAGHDAMVLSTRLPTAMLFVPSIGGRSHDSAEDTHEADICLGAEVLAEAIVAIADERR